MAIRPKLRIALAVASAAMAVGGELRAQILVTDIQAAVNAFLFDTDVEEVPHLDVTADDLINAVDVQVMVNLLLLTYAPQSVMIQHPRPVVLPVNQPVGASVSPWAFSPVTPLTWSVVDGGLPPGLVLGANGVVTGTPSAAGTYQALVRAEGGVYIGERWIRWEVGP